VEYFLRRAPFVVSAYRQSQVWSKIISAMSNGAYGFVSGYLTNTALSNYGNNPWNTLLTCGDAARGLTAAVTGTPATLKITLNDLALDGSGRVMTGIGVEGSNIRYERQEYFYDNTTVIITLDEVSKFQKSVSKEHLYNLLRIGYKYQSNDTLNGKDDPHTTQAWASAGVRVNKEEDMISPFIASMYEWEYIRANLSEKNTTDDAGDNNILVVEVNGQNASGQYLLYRPQNMLGNSVTGLVAGDTAFNLTLLPKYNLLRNGPRNHTALHLMDNTSLKFQSADQNTEVQTKITGSTIVEKSDVPVSSMPAPLFLPIIFQFETPVPPEFHALINNNPYGRINFRVRHPLTNELLTFGGFIDEVNIKPADRSVCQWKLLAAPDTDLDKLNY
jgi:hypothetical protein